MKIARWIFIGITFSLTGASADSLLTPTAFPKTFQDVSFADRMAVLAEGYGVFDRQYDENGKCISGCPYAGITIEQDQQDVEEATETFAQIVNEIDNQDTQNNPDNQYTPNNNNIAIQPGVNGNNNTTNHGGIYNPPRNTTPTRDSIPLRSPVNDKSILITSDFYFRLASGVQGFHGGVDIGVEYGTPVVATADGVVVVAGSSDYNGPYIKIKHDKGFYSWYLHLSKINVAPGTQVRKGQVIGLSGNQGKRSQGAHLDYRISMEKDGRDIWVDILCPCKATKKQARSLSGNSGFNQSATASYNENVGEYQCVHSSFWQDRYYSFVDSTTKQRGATWRIQSGHCMRTMNDKLPDEK